MKKIFAVFLSLCLVCCFSVNAFALNSDNQDGNIEVSAIVNPAYTVTIPEKVELNKSADITATDVLTQADKVVKVTVSGTNQIENAFTISTTDGVKIEYEIVKTDKSVLKINDSLVFETDGTEKLNFEQITSSQVFAGEYKGTVNFTISYTTNN